MPCSKAQANEPKSTCQDCAGSKDPTPDVTLRSGNGTKQDHGIEVNVGVEPCQGNRRECSSVAWNRLYLGVRFHPRRGEGASGGKKCIDEQEPGATKAGDGDEPRSHGQQGAESCDPGEDQDCIGEQANQDGRSNMFPADALAQDERILGTDGNNQGQSGGQAVYKGKVCHQLRICGEAMTRRTKDSKVPLEFLIMDFPAEQLQTLKAVVETGTLDRAARQLNVTASAVSQRLKALEKQAGSVLFIRSRPIRTTSSGDVLLRLARETHMLSAEAHRALGLESGTGVESRRTDLSIAVNADSLASWFAPVLAGLADQELMMCEILRNDEEFSTELLRSGRVMGAVTTNRTPVQGCSSEYLGTVRYRAMASRGFTNQWLPGIDPVAELATAPMVSFDRTDGLQRSIRRSVVGGTATEPPVEYFIPDSRVYVAAVAASMGWGMIPEIQVPDDGSLVCLNEAWSSDVHLYWQRWKVPSQALDLLTALVRNASRAARLHRNQ